MMESQKPRLSLKGSNGQIELYEHFLLITRKGLTGFLTHGFDGAKIIFLKALTGIQFKSAGKATKGYIQFVFQGSQESKGGLKAAVSDENTVLFTEKEATLFTQLLDILLKEVGKT